MLKRFQKEETLIEDARDPWEGLKVDDDSSLDEPKFGIHFSLSLD